MKQRITDLPNFSKWMLEQGLVDITERQTINSYRGHEFSESHDCQTPDDKNHLEEEEFINCRVSSNISDTIRKYNVYNDDNLLIFHLNCSSSNKTFILLTNADQLHFKNELSPTIYHRYPPIEIECPPVSRENQHAYFGTF